jgi:hypothetical protein
MSRVKSLLSQTPIPTSLQTSDPLGVSRSAWVDFLIDIAGNTGGAVDSTEVDGYIECSEDGSTWRRLTVEEIASGTGDATQYDYHFVRAFSGATFATVVTAPVTGLFMRVAIKGNGTPAAGSSLTVSAVLRSV